MRIRSPDRLLGFPSGFPLGLVPPKNLDERNSLFPHDSVLTIQNSLRSSDFFPSPECDSVLYEDFSKIDALPSTDNEDKVFNTGILIHENLFEVTIRLTPDKNVKKISISNAPLILKDFNPPLYELPFHKEVLRSETLLSFSSENEEKVFNPEILTSKGVHTSLLQKLSHRGPKAFKVIKNFESLMEIFPCSYVEDIRILDVPLFDEFFSPRTSVASLVYVEEAPAPVESAGSPSSTTINQDAPSRSTLQTTPELQSQKIPLCAEEESHDLEVAHMSNDPHFGISIPETTSEDL
nr:hypothetical protein [Tanacetum cinerariifolium]